MKVLEHCSIEHFHLELYIIRCWNTHAKIYTLNILLYSILYSEFIDFKVKQFKLELCVIKCYSTYLYIRV